MLEMFYRGMPLLASKHTLQTCGSAVGLKSSSTILRCGVCGGRLVWRSGMSHFWGAGMSHILVARMPHPKKQF